MSDQQDNEIQMMLEKITVSIARSIGWITFDNPRRHNALTQKMWLDLPGCIKSLENSPDVKVIVLKGAGEKAFCAGADISEFDVVRKDATTAQIYEQDNVRAFDAINQSSKPVIAMIGGLCFGGGFGIAAAADLRIASDDAVFSVPAAKLGLAYPVAAISNIVDAVGEQTTKEMLFCASRFTAAEMYERGFLLKTCSADQLLSEATNLASAIAENAPLSILAAKQSINALRTSGEARLIEQANNTAASTFDSNDYREGRAAFKQRRKPDFNGN